jgi:hypothetical protein
VQKKDIIVKQFGCWLEKGACVALVGSSFFISFFVE